MIEVMVFMNKYIDSLKTMDGNYCYPRKSPDTGESLEDGVFIAQKNAELLVENLKIAHEIVEVLIVPFLVSDLKHYELLWYETNVGIVDGPTQILKYNEKNCLPQEVLDKLSPGLRVNKEDFSSFITFLEDYFASMRTMTFKDDSDFAHELWKQNPRVYYEFS